MPDCAGPVPGTVQLWPHRHGTDAMFMALLAAGAPRPLPVHPPSVEIEVDDRVVRVSNPDRVYFPRAAPPSSTWWSTTSLSAGIVNALFERPCMLHRFPKGLSGDKVHQKRVPAGAPPWVETVQLHFPRWNRTADELCVTELARR